MVLHILYTYTSSTSSGFSTSSTAYLQKCLLSQFHLFPEAL
ncbi:hypothetical protein CHCC20441_3001 [Bacillus licheniformis]|nr:hypothetical protein CHCC20441_3001 [Bacillus licheniformis]TWL48491.1 hypothetical protein CHCC15335_1279 [Bacillus licheniformis]TWM78466.1 hypothetical protein CHCC14808_1795 [Bacillus licheniformis]